LSSGGRQSLAPDLDITHDAARIARIPQRHHRRIRSERGEVAAGIHQSLLHVVIAQHGDCPIDRETFRYTAHIYCDVRTRKANASTGQ
jgi:hypothetical protein